MLLLVYFDYEYQRTIEAYSNNNKREREKERKKERKREREREREPVDKYIVDYHTMSTI